MLVHHSRGNVRFLAKDVRICTAVFKEGNGHKRSLLNSPCMYKSDMILACPALLFEMSVPFRKEILGCSPASKEVVCLHESLL